MRKLATLCLAGVLGVLLTAGDASACHKKRCHCAPAPEPCVTVTPCPPPVVVCEVKVKKVKGCHKCGGPKHGLLGGCHKKQAACAPAPCAAPVTYAYAAPQAFVAPTSQAIAAPQGITVPGKATPQGY
jgi:hypothetical protein